jgi:RND family efflux transporter MFP subunit
MRTLTLLLISLALVGSHLIYADSLHPVMTQAVEHQQSYQVERLFAGRVMGSQRADIGFEQPGRVAKVLVEDGQVIAAGDTLAVLDQRSLKIEQIQLQAQQTEIRARLGQLRRDLERYRALREKSYVSEGQLDALETQLQANQAQDAQLAAQLDGVQLRLDKTRLKAPFAGEIARLQLEEGMVVSQGQAVMQLVELGRSEAVFAISDRLGRDLTLGQSMQVFGDFGDVQASLVAVANNLDWRTQTRNIRVVLPRENAAVDGNTAYIRLPQRRVAEGFWVPQQALLEDLRGTWAVFALSGDGGADFVVRKHSVQVLYHHRGRAYIQAELEDGRLIITEGLHRLAPGQRVRLAEGEGASHVAVTQ